MLIPSPRHRPKDLELWRELEAADVEHWHAGRVADKLARSLVAVREFASKRQCYASVSWGKDSVILAHLVTRMAESGGPCVPLGFVSVGVDLDQGCDAVRDNFLSLWPHPYREIHTAPGLRDDRGTRGKREGFRQLDVEFGQRRLMGIRADESSGRHISALAHGIATDRVCRPLLWWSTADVFAALAFLGLPVHPNYAMLGGGRWDRDGLRTAPVGGTRGVRIGRREWEREYYGDVLNRLAVPNLSSPPPSW